jgi:hypothetical protein
MVRSERLNRAIRVVFFALALAAMTLVWSGVSLRDLLRSVFQ